MSVVLPPPERPTRPTFSPGAIVSWKSSKSGGAVGEAHVAEAHPRVVRLEGNRVGRVGDLRRCEEQLRELRRVREGRLHTSVNAIELPHHACRGREVIEREEYLLDANSAPPAERERDDEAKRIGQYVER